MAWSCAGWTFASRCAELFVACRRIESASLTSSHDGDSARTVADHEADTADWHIHWVVPGLGFAGCNGQQQVVSRDTAKADDAGTDLWQPVPPILIVALDLNETCEQPIILASASSFQLVGLLASRQSLPELMGSMRC